MSDLANMWFGLPDSTYSNEEFATAPNTPPLETWQSDGNLSGAGAIGELMLDFLDSNPHGNNSFEWFDVSDPESDQGAQDSDSTPWSKDSKASSNGEHSGATPKAKLRSSMTSDAFGDTPRLPCVAKSSPESGPARAALYGVDALFAELMAQTEPEEHRYRRSIAGRIKRLAHVLLKLYNMSAESSGKLAIVEEWVASQAFTNILGLVCTCPLRQDLLPALRLLCHLQTLCLKCSPPTPPGPMSPSSVRVECTGSWGSTLPDAPISDRYAILKHIISLSVGPIIDFDGRVL